MATRRKRRRDERLTLREAFEKHYDKDDLAAGSVALYRHTLARWERLTDNPPVCDINNEVIHAFRQAQLADGLSPATINSGWTMLRAILRRLAPPETGNPRGLGIIDLQPWMRRVKHQPKPARRLTQEELDQLYLHASRMTLPKVSAPAPAEFWRGLLVAGYFTGLRKSDLLGIRADSLNASTCTLTFTARKTGKQMDLPLHPAAMEHLQRLLVPGRDLVFGGIRNWQNGDYCRRLRDLARHAGVEKFTLQNIRSTAASEIERVRPGMGAVLLQHRPMDVTGQHYLNQFEELTEAIHGMRCPVTFKHGPRHAQRTEKRERDRRQQLMRDAVLACPGPPDADDWQFPEDGNAFCFRGQWLTCLRGQSREVLQELATAGEPVPFQRLAHRLWGNRWRSRQNAHPRVCAIVSNIRDGLRRSLYLSEQFDPVPCVERGTGGKWTLYLPQV